MRTSISHPLQIAEVIVAEGLGKLGITFCPGKVQSFGQTGAWHRDLGLDLDAIVAWNAAVVVTLIEKRELILLQVPGLGDAARARHIDWVHLPIVDRGVPEAAFERAWETVGQGLRARLPAGCNVLVHYMGALGRAGTIASRLLVELGR
jgi:ADP-ribosyl-[dinitrogen reductase] hydrolase